MLLETRFDALPEPVRRGVAASGFVHRTLAPTTCPTCEGLDDARMCPGCRGRGWVEVPRVRDPYSVDHVAAAGTDTVKVGFVPDRDAEIGRLVEQTAAAVMSELDLVAWADSHPYGWEVARGVMYARFDYRALDLALERLAGLVVAPRSRRGLALLDAWLPVPLRAPGSGAVGVVNAAAHGRGSDARARAQRDRVAVELLAGGADASVVAARVGVSVRQLRRIVSSNRVEAA